MNKDYEKAKKQVEEIRKIKIDSLVRARRGEFWIKEYTPELNNVTKNFEDTKKLLKGIFEIKHLPWWLHAIAHTQMMISNPIKYFIRIRYYKKGMIDSYWAFKRIKKEWEDDFNMTEEAIDRDYNVYYKCNKTVKKTEFLLKQWEKKIKLRKRYK